MPTSPPPARVLTVGAYERDNFGDLLFLLMTEHALGQVPGPVGLVAGAPFAADMTALLDRPVAAFGERLAAEPYDVVWGVGGQVGGLDVPGAYRMSVPREEFRAFQRSTYARQQEILRAATGGVLPATAYLPNLAQFPLNAGAVSVVNSVGVAGLRSRPVHVREELVEILRGTDLLSVRDRESSALLDELGIEHRLGPDVVHAIGRIHPAERDPDSDVVVVQASNLVLRTVGHAELAKQLVASDALAGLRFQLIMAGAAAGHDSIASLTRLADAIRELDPTRSVEVRDERRPLDIVDQIRRARIVIGTSLHVRIVSSAYGVPRVTLVRPKSTRYARHWDPLMPYDVALSDLDGAAAAALAAGSRPEVAEAAARLTTAAYDNLVGLAGDALRLARERTADERARIAVRREAASAPLVARREECERTSEPIRLELDQVRGDLTQARRDLSAARAELGGVRAELAAIQAASADRRSVALRVRRRIGRALPAAVRTRLGK